MSNSKPNSKKLSKNQYRRQQAKEKKQSGSTQDGQTQVNGKPTGEIKPEEQNGDTTPAIKEEPTSDVLNFSEDDPLYAQFKSVLNRFDQLEDVKTEPREPEQPQIISYHDDDGIPSEDEENEPQKLSKKKIKQQNKLTVAQLKANVEKPDLVEWTDPSSKDPRLLIALKSSRNVVNAPSHWSMKREYLSSRRGVEKSAFALPPWLAQTGIGEARDAVLEKQAQETLKQKSRAAVAGKTSKISFDYGQLYNAFFELQSRPDSTTRYYDVYYEGREYETNLRHLRPGELSEELKEALNIPPGAPPPWLINQQRFGPPPSYPALRIPGLNAPPPPGSSWGFHPGGYGKPPVDEFNRPLYGGDVFGQPSAAQHNTKDPSAGINKTRFGQVEVLEDESDEEEEESDDEDEGQPGEDGMRTGIQSTSGFTSVAPSEPSGIQSVQSFSLRKDKRGTETEESVHPRSAGVVLQEQQRSSSGFFGSDRGYNLSGGVPVLEQEDRGKKRKAGDIDVSVDMDALVREGKMSKEDLQRQYDAGRKAQSDSQFAQSYDDDLSQMIAEESAKRQKKDQERKGRR